MLSLKVNLLIFLKTLINLFKQSWHEKNTEKYYMPCWLKIICTIMQTISNKRGMYEHTKSSH